MSSVAHSLLIHTCPFSPAPGFPRQSAPLNSQTCDVINFTLTSTHRVTTQVQYMDYFTRLLKSPAEMFLFHDSSGKPVSRLGSKVAQSMICKQPGPFVSINKVLLEYSRARLFKACGWSHTSAAESSPCRTDRMATNPAIFTTCLLQKSFLVPSFYGTPLGKNQGYYEGITLTRESTNFLLTKFKIQ